jgi:hypothetical protein
MTTIDYPNIIKYQVKLVSCKSYIMLYIYIFDYNPHDFYNVYNVSPSFMIFIDIYRIYEGFLKGWYHMVPPIQIKPLLVFTVNLDLGSI